MPTTAADSREFRELIRFTVSAPYELLLSLGTVHWQPPRHAAWAATARAALGPDLLAEAAFFYGELWHPLVLMEFPVDYTGPADRVRPFLDYVAHMDPDTFLFYMWGRIIPREEVAVLRADPDAVRARIHDFYESTWPGSGDTRTRGKGLTEAAVDPQGLQRRLVALLRAYAARVFTPLLPALRRAWAESLDEQARLVAATDPRAYVERLLDGRALPPMFPEGTPMREIRVIPSRYTWRANFEIWGYGTLILIYDAGRTERQAQEREATAARLTEVAAALADPNRLKILALIAQDPEAYGHKLAAACGISRPAVSRHMGILKRAGLVEEAPSEGRVAYRLCRAALESFLPQLFDYLEK